MLPKCFSNANHFHEGRFLISTEVWIEIAKIAKKIFNKLKVNFIDIFTPNYGIFQNTFEGFQTILKIRNGVLICQFDNILI